MPRTHYPEVITESVDELLAAERALGSQRAQPQMAMLRPLLLLAPQNRISCCRDLGDQLQIRPQSPFDRSS